MKDGLRSRVQVELRGLFESSVQVEWSYQLKLYTLLYTLQ